MSAAIVHTRFRMGLLPTWDHLTRQLVECYREVFADTPWNEWYKCTKCGEHWGTKDKVQLEHWGWHHCGKKLVEFWPREKVLQDLKRELTPSTSCWISIEDDGGKGKLVGFCWGYEISAKKLEKELGIKFKRKLDECVGQGRIAYQDDMGVLSSHRNRGIAKELFRVRLDDFLEEGLEIGIVRTRRAPEPSQTYLWFHHRLGYEIIAEYEDGRVVLARKLEGLKEALR